LITGGLARSGLPPEKGRDMFRDRSYIALGLLACLLFLYITPVQARAFEIHQAVSAGISGFLEDGDNGQGHTDYIMHELQLAPLVSVYAKAGFTGYTYDNGSYAESARGFGGEIGFNVYPYMRWLQGLYLGGGIGTWHVEGHWKDDLGTPFATSGKGRANLLGSNLHMGYKTPINMTNVFIDTTVQLGFLAADGTPDLFGLNDPSVTVGIAIGIAW
jgi:hypothetical protein